MNESTESIKTELQEMARVILCEIYGGKKPCSGCAEADYVGSLHRTARRTETAYEEFSRQSIKPDDGGAIQRKSDSFDEGVDFSPRLSRREFFEQRIQRRSQRQVSNESIKKSSISEKNFIIKSSDNLAALDLSEKISNNFRRDSRRYDGAFERY